MIWFDCDISFLEHSVVHQHLCVLLLYWQVDCCIFLGLKYLGYISNSVWCWLLEVMWTRDWACNPWVRQCWLRVLPCMQFMLHNSCNQYMHTWMSAFHTYLNACIPHIPECSASHLIVLDVLIFSILSYCPYITIMGDWAWNISYLLFPQEQTTFRISLCDSTEDHKHVLKEAVKHKCI